MFVVTKKKLKFIFKYLSSCKFLKCISNTVYFPYNYCNKIYSKKTINIILMYALKVRLILRISIPLLIIVILKPCAIALSYPFVLKPLNFKENF